MVLDSRDSKRNDLHHVFHMVANRLNHDKHNAIHDSKKTLDKVFSSHDVFLNVCFFLT